jgi:DNA polymerase
MYLDTLSMARGVHSHHLKFDLDSLAKAHGLKGKVRKHALLNAKDKRDLTPEEFHSMAEYCVDDVEDTYLIAQDLVELIPPKELHVIDLFIRMACQPVLKVDKRRLLKHKRAEAKRRADLLERVGIDKKDLVSNDKFATVLQTFGVDPPRKISPRTGQETWAFAKTDLAFQELSEHPSEAVRDLYEARRLCKSSIEETRTDRMLDVTHGGESLLPVFLNYAGAHTLRSSGANKLNLQNLTRKGELRKAIVVDNDEMIVVVDESQIEARLTAYFCDLKTLVEAFAAGDDAYKIMASQIYGIPVKDIQPDQRFIGKICVLALGFQMGAARFQQTLEQGTMGPKTFLPEHMYSQIVHAYRSANPGLEITWNLMGHILFCMQQGIEGEYKFIRWGKSHILLPNGQRLHYPGLKGTVNTKPANGFRRWYSPTLEDATFIGKHGPTKIFPGLLLENIIQAVARIIVTDAMVEIDEKVDCDIASMTHDEVIAVCAEKKAQQVFDQMVEIMTKPVPWAPGLPLAAEGGWARNYSK